VADIYTVTDIQPDIQYQVRIHIHSGGYTEVVQDTQHDIHSDGYMAADTQQRIHSGRRTAADTVVDIQHSRHSGGYTVADTQWRIHNGGYTAADTQQHQIKIHSG